MNEMAPVFAWLRGRIGNDRGATAVEYALMLALIAIVIIAAVTALGTAASERYADPVLNGALD